MQNSESKLWDKKYTSARDYNNREDVFIFSKTNPTIQSILPYIKEGTSILEVGSGTGELITYVGTLYSNLVTKGLDFSAQSVSHSQKIASQFNFKTEFVQGDIKNMPFESESFDIVFGDQVLGHVDDIGVALKEIYRITKKNGIVAFSAGNSLRPDGWLLHKKLSQKHEGYKQKSMFPWELKNYLKRAQFIPLSLYGDILVLFRNVSLIKNLFKSKRTVQIESENFLPPITHLGKMKILYRTIDKWTPGFLKVTIGIVGRK